MSHNLDITKYTFYELLDLFELDHRNISVEDLKRAKKKVLYMHPDKSRLGPEYFLFYKKAFSVIVHMYENTLKTSQSVPTDHEIDYVPEKTNPDLSGKQIQKTIGKIDQKTFHSQFNQLFEENMSQKIDPEKNKWFQEEDPMYHETSQVRSVGQMGQAFDAIKQRNNDMILYKGVAPMMNTGGTGNLYDDDEQDTGTYISSDPFSKLKFDDLRKVHKDQTVFAVSERDIDKVKQYRSVDEYQRARGNDYTPMERSEANRLMESQEQMFQEKMRQKQYQSQLRTMEAEQKNKTVLSNFLRIQS